MALRLGVTQYEIENEFYMIDLVELSRLKQKQEAVRRLEWLQLITAPNMDKVDYKAFVNGLLRAAEIKPPEEQGFSRKKMDQLHAFTAAMKAIGRGQENGDSS